MKTRSKPLFNIFTLFMLVISLFGSSLTFTPAYAETLPSCVGTNACLQNSGVIGSDSCNGDSACMQQSSTIGNGSCNGTNACLQQSTFGPDPTGMGGGTCPYDFPCATIGDNSCNGASPCYQNHGTIGNNSCNGPGVQCREKYGVGDCQYNNIYVAACASHQSGPNFTVNSTSDTDDGYCDALGAYDNCTLREAISAANELIGADVINIPAGTYTLAIPGTGEDANATGDLDITGELTINGTGAKASDVIIQAGTDNTNGIDRVFHMVNDVSVTITNITVANGKTSTGPADSTGGGIENLVGGDLTVLNSIFSGNTSIYGGGINHYYGTLIVMNTTFSDNTVRPGGGGGGIHNAFNNSAQIINSTFSGNQATNGGGIANAINGSMTVTNSTFSDNLAANSGAGSGIRNENEAVDSVILQNTIIANSASGGDCYGVITADTHNLDTDGSCDNAMQKPTAEINLGPLQDNGGATPTMLPAFSSLVIDEGDDTVCPATDQRGISRNLGACDIGAVERGRKAKSASANDGWVLESKEFSNIANTKMNTGDLRVGDDAKNRQYRSLLYFDTAYIPNNAVISKAVVKIKMAGTTKMDPDPTPSTDPFTTHGNLVADMKKGFFGLAALQTGDFSALAAPINTAGKFNPSTPPDDWYTLTLNPANFKYINLVGATQFRVRFAKDDNNDKDADFITFYGDGSGVNAPQFFIEYSLP